MLYVNINYICNKYVIYYIFGIFVLCRFLISFQRVNWCKIFFIRDKLFQENMDVVFLIFLLVFMLQIYLFLNKKVLFVI